MRGLALFMLPLVIICGCASHSEQAPRVYEDHPAAVLAFDPPVIVGMPPLNLWRDRRAAEAFVGFDEPSVTWYYTRTEDFQGFDRRGRGDQYTRESHSERVGATFRP